MLQRFLESSFIKEALLGVDPQTVSLAPYVLIECLGLGFRV